MPAARSLRVSIGIPAYNEAANIGRLLKEVLEQIEDGFTLAEVLVASDGSTDATTSIVTDIQDPRVKCNASTKRLGKTARINQLLGAFTGDVIVLLDADMLLNNPRFLSTALNGFESSMGLLAPHATPMPGRTAVEKCLGAGMSVVERAAVRWNQGANYLSFRGACLILSADFARHVKMPATLVTNDAYLFFFAQQLGYHPVYRPGLHVYFRAPTTLQDHVRQSQRFKYSGEELTAVLKNFDARQSYHIPARILLGAMAREFLVHPLRLTGYILINVYTRLLARTRPSATWEMASSTKSLD